LLVLRYNTQSYDKKIRIFSLSVQVIAGMSFALKVAHKGSVALICKAGLEEANTYYAQEASLQ